MNKKVGLSLNISIIVAILLTIQLTKNFLLPRYINIDKTPQINGDYAMQTIVDQLNFGPRIPASSAHDRFVSWIQQELLQDGWIVTTQTGFYHNQSINNIIAKNSTDLPLAIVGAHYDSRMTADRDSQLSKRNDPVPGANDGASGIAVLLELARTLARSEKSIWLVFFDAEDNGGLPGWDWSMGSRYFVSILNFKPENVVILDMIGDKDLNIYIERNSDPRLIKEIWGTARSLGYANHFISEPKYSLLDDHSPFLEAGISAIDIIDFDYPYYHTTEDTIDKVSAESLEIVGNTVLYWLFQLEQ